MSKRLRLGEMSIDVVRKEIKNIHLSVHPPTGRVRIAAPGRVSEDAIRAFAIGKLGWIRAQQKALGEQERETPREYIDRESHFVWGKRCLLRVVERDAPPAVEWRQSRLRLCVRPGTSADRRAAVLDRWYRDQLRAAAEPLACQWQRRLEVRLKGLFVQRMKTRWGSCNPVARTIRLNTDLAKKPLPCLEYILVHELVHFIDRTHGARFVALMDELMPGWRHRRALLNRLPVRHEDWAY
ncbi:MAG: M48 family metallopeptidase [Acidobacteria bacterium]|nr:M48 family metallopeptidase [Acidobacteriota bacterium]